MPWVRASSFAGAFCLVILFFARQSRHLFFELGDETLVRAVRGLDKDVFKAQLFGVGDDRLVFERFELAVYLGNLCASPYGTYWLINDR